MKVSEVLAYFTRALNVYKEMNNLKDDAYDSRDLAVFVLDRVESMQMSPPSYRRGPTSDEIARGASEDAEIFVCGWERE